jgi:uncharacterized protein (TIGR03083 family)
VSVIPDKQQIRDDLEGTRRAYHELLESLSEDDWRRRSGNPDFTVKALMWHMAWALGWLARSIDRVRQAKGFNPPGFLVNPLRELAIRAYALRATPERAARRYDEGHAALLARLDEVRDDEWSITVTQFGEPRTAEWYLRQPIEHFAEHGADVQTVLPTPTGGKAAE